MREPKHGEQAVWGHIHKRAAVCWSCSPKVMALLTAARCTAAVFAAPALQAHHLCRHVGCRVHQQVKLKLHGAGGACAGQSAEQSKVS